LNLTFQIKNYSIYFFGSKKCADSQVGKAIL
jgi:hypothetical protein